MKISIQRLRNITTGRLHTEVEHIYEDLGIITGQQGLMTHMLPRVMEAVRPWLKRATKSMDGRLWDGRFDDRHVGIVELPDPTVSDRASMFAIYKSLPNPLLRLR